MKIDSTNLQKKLFLIKIKLPMIIGRNLNLIGKELQRNIVSGAAFEYSPSWQSAIKSDGTRYINGSPRGGGLRLAIQHMANVQVFGVGYLKSDQSSINQKGGGASSNIMLGIGHIRTMDLLTKKHGKRRLQKPGGWWRLFEYGEDGQRDGGSETHGFIPFEGFGRMGEGYSTWAVDYERKWSEEKSKSEVDVILRKNRKLNPGVLPVRLFHDSLLYYKRRIPRILHRAVLEGLKDLSWKSNDVAELS